MGKKKKSAKQVPLPDINAAAEKTYAMNKQGVIDQTLANRANQTNQYGSVNWSRDPTTGAWTQTEAYNPEQQALLDQQVKNQGMMGRSAEDVLGKGDFTYSGAPQAAQVGQFNQQATDLMNQLRQPGLDRARASKEAQLAAMGLGTGSGRAWDTEQANIGLRENEAGLQSALAGIQQGNTMFGQQNQLRQNYVNEQNQMLQNAGGMMAGAAPEDLKFGSYAQQGFVGAPDYATNAMKMWEAQQAAANAKAKGRGGGMLGGIGSLAGGVIGGIYGGPAGASAGASIGGSAGGMLDQ